MIWKKLCFAMDHPPRIKKGDFTGTYVSECGDFMIEPEGPDGLYRLCGRTQEGCMKINYKSISGGLDFLKTFDLMHI